MPQVTISQKDKELIAVACSVSAGCQRCSDYHFKAVFEAGATKEEVEKAVQDATSVILHADEMMQRKAYSLMEVAREDLPVAVEADDRLVAFRKLGAAVTSNCTPTITAYLTAAQSTDATGSEIKMTIKLAKMVLHRAGEFADEAISEALEQK